MVAYFSNNSPLYMRVLSELIQGVLSLKCRLIFAHAVSFFSSTIAMSGDVHPIAECLE